MMERQVDGKREREQSELKGKTHEHIKKRLKRNHRTHMALQGEIGES